MMSPDLTTILILTDGRPGHETQSTGIATILNKEENYRVEYLNIQHPKKWLKQFFKMAFSLLPKQWMLNSFISAEQLSHLVATKKIQYILSAGGDTLLPNALLKMYLAEQGIKAKNIIATSLRGMPPKAYDIVFTIDENKKNQSPYLYYPIAPNKLLSFNLEEEQGKARQLLTISKDLNVWSILIGATTQDVNIGPVTEWIGAIQNLVTAYPDDIFFICTSRRTPVEFEKALRSELQNISKVKLILFGEGNLTSVADIMHASNIIICSPDSTSMVSESLMLEKPVFIAQLLSTTMNEGFKEYYTKIQQKGWLQLNSLNNLDIVYELEKFDYSMHADILLEKFNAAT